MKRRLLAILLILCMCTSGCFSYRDINKLLVVVTTVIDVDEDNNVVIYLEVFKPYRSEQSAAGKGQRLIYKSKAPTILEAIRDLNLGTSMKLNFTQNKILIFTKRAAEKGLDKFIDFLNRDQEFVLRQFLYLFEQDPEQLMNMQLMEEEYIGLYLYEFPVNQAASTKRHVTRLDDYLNNRLKGDQINILPIISLDLEHMDSQLRIIGAAVLKDDKYVGEMTIDETAIYNMMTGPIRTGTILIPFDDGNKITLEIMGTKIKNDISYDGKTVQMTKEISIRTTFAGTQKPIELNQPEVRKEIIQKAEKEVEQKCSNLFDKWKEKGIDSFKIRNLFDRRYSKEKLKVKNVIEITELKTDINVTIEGSTDVTDFYD